MLGVLQHTLVNGAIPPQIQDLPFSLLNLLSFLLTHSCHGPCGWQHNPLVYLPLCPAPRFVSSANCRGNTLPCHPDHWWRFWTELDPALTPEVRAASRAASWPLTRLCLTCSVFSVAHCVCLSRPCFTGFSVSFLWDSVKGLTAVQVDNICCSTFVLYFLYTLPLISICNSLTMATRVAEISEPVHRVFKTVILSKRRPVPLGF